MLLAMQIVLGACFVATGIGTIVKISKDKREELKNGTGKQWVVGMFVGFVCNFLDTLGCGSYAPSTALYKIFNNQDDINIPGTLNVGDTFPVIFEALVFTTEVPVEPKFLIAMVVASAVGSYGFANIVVKWPRNKIRWGLGICMPLLAIVMACRNLGIGPFGVNGTAIGLVGWRAAVAIGLNVVWGALMDIGFGLYAPCMATCILLGLDAGTCWPVFMTSCALLMPACSIAFIKSGRFDAIATLGNMIAGCIGVAVAFYLVHSLPLFWLINLVCVVLLYTSYTLISAAIRDKKAGIE